MEATHTEQQRCGLPVEHVQGAVSAGSTYSLSEYLGARMTYYVSG